METEREHLDIEELGSEELDNITEVTSYLLNSIAQKEVFEEDFDTSKPSRVLNYEKEINTLPTEYNQQIENLEKPYIGEILWGDEQGVIVETIKFSENAEIQKRIYIPIKEVCNNLGFCNPDLLYLPNYQNFSKAVEYMSEDITSRESLKNFLDNPGYQFIYDDTYKSKEGFATFTSSGKKFSFHKKNVDLPLRELKKVENWKYITDEIFELLKLAPIVDRDQRNYFIVKMVENNLSNHYLEGEGGFIGGFTVFNYKNSSVVMIVTKKE